MFTHVFLGSNDIEKSRQFYDATMSVRVLVMLSPSG